MSGKRVMMIGLDGADPFVLKKLFEQGRLPNMKKAVENGVVGDKMAMIGAFPSVTPPNWASLATGNWPKAHGVTCFFNHTLGNELNVMGMNWDAQRVESELIWEKYAEEGKRCLMLNYCEAWPPRGAAKDNCVFVDGSGVVPFLRCQGGFQKEIFLEEGDFPLKEVPHYVAKGAADCVVYGDAFDEMAKDSVKNGYSSEKAARVPSPINLPTVDTAFPAQGQESFPTYEEIAKNGDSMGDEAIADRMTSALKEPIGFNFELPPSAKAAAIMINDGLLRRFFVISASDGEHYDTVTLYEGRKNEKILGQAKAGEWSDFVFDTYSINDKKEPMVYRFRVIELDPEGKSARIYMSHQIKANGYKDYCYPANVWGDMYPEVGPFLPFGKFNLIDHECLETTVESWDNAYRWHEKAAEWMFKTYPDWQLFYTHVHGIDEFNHWFIHKSIEGSNADYKHYEELINRMYEINDRYVGKLMEQLDGNTAIFITSDHAAVPHSIGTTNPGIGSLSAIQLPVMEELGLTKSYDDANGIHQIKWDETIAVAQRSSYIYINLKGRDPHGIVEPEDYEKTVQMVIDKLYGYRHPVTGERVVAFCLTRNEMEMVGMGGEHVGDILYQVKPTYCNEHAFSPSTSTNEGYSLNNLCIMTGAGFKKGVKINRTVRIVDVVPTICHLGEVPMVSNVEGGVIWQALEGFEEKSYK